MTVRGQTGVAGLAIISIVCAGGEMTNWDIETVRARLRLASGLTLMAFVTMHMMAHVALLVSFEWADTALAFLMAPWRTMPGTVLLAAAFLAHYANALWSIYSRRSLRMPQWELWQVLLGLAIPFLVVAPRDGHPRGRARARRQRVLCLGPADALVFGAVDRRLADGRAAGGLGARLHRRPFLAAQQALVPRLGRGIPRLRHSIADAGARRFYRRRQPDAPRGRSDPDYISAVRQNTKATPEAVALVYGGAKIALLTHIGLVGFAFGARALRGWLYRRREPPI